MHSFFVPMIFEHVIFYSIFWARNIMDDLNALLGFFFFFSWVACILIVNSNILHFYDSD